LGEGKLVTARIFIVPFGKAMRTLGFERTDYGHVVHYVVISLKADDDEMRFR